MINNNKLDIVFNLDNILYYGYLTNPEKYKELKILYPEKDIKLISFNIDKTNILNILILRKGLFEFFEFTKSFCNYYICSLGIEQYVIATIKILEDIFGIKFKGFKSRKDLKQNKKLLEDLSLDSKRTIIFDNKPTWPKDNLNIIISKVFIDKDFIQFYSK